MSEHINETTGRIIHAAIEVHKVLGPGLLESAYEECLAYEFKINNIPYKQQVPLPVNYKGHSVACGYRLDFLVDSSVVVELKSLEAILPIHHAQVLTYLKLGGWKVGLMINFHVPLLKNGIFRLING